MKCDMKTMIKTGLGLGVVVAVAYATLPVAREWIAASAPFPLMMVFMMKGMQSCDKEQSVEKDQADKAPSKPLTGQIQLKD